MAETGLDLRKRLPIPMAEGNPLLPAPIHVRGGNRCHWVQVKLDRGCAVS